MSKVERKEYQETKILRTVSPVRGTRGSNQNLAQFDNNLDHLLEDLQSSVTGPVRTGGNTYKEIRTVSNADHGRSNSLNRVTHLKASNPVTEYSSDDAYSYTSPDGTKSVKTFKKESYSYQTSSDKAPPEKIRMQNNINQLDSLLDDLQQVKQGSNYNAGIDPGLIDTGSSKVVTTKKTVQRELQYGDSPVRTSSRTRSLERGDRESSLTREIQYIDEGTYGETRRIKPISPSNSASSTLTRQKKVTNVQSYPLEVIETSTPDINPEILASLDPDLMPAGNTKVTTTIKTYTYEIPGSGYQKVGTSPPPSTETERFIYSPNQSQTTPSRSFVYNKVENNTVTDSSKYSPRPAWKSNLYNETITTNRQNIEPYQKPTPPPGSGKTLIKETVTTRNYQPGYPHYLDGGSPGKQTYVYNETTTTKNLNDNGYPIDDRGYPNDRGYPSRNEKYIIKETHNSTTNRSGGPYANGYPRQEPNQTSVIYKHDTHTSNNYVPPYKQNPPNTTVIVNKTTENTENYDPNRSPYPHGGRGTPYDPHYDPNNVNITYKYTTHSTSRNNYQGYPPKDDSLPLLRPQPFPSDRTGPPKAVDDLMANIGREPPDSPFNSGYTAHEAELIQQRKVENLKQQHVAADLQKKEPKNVPATKNISGPAVYYPPGHEMFAKKEESGGWRAEGAMAKESGKYKYEAESGSKTKTRSGAAVVPVCLPLCCGLPCTLL